jgi:hypothetical protein
VPVCSFAFTFRFVICKRQFGDSTDSAHVCRKRFHKFTISGVLCISFDVVWTHHKTFYVFLIVLHLCFSYSRSLSICNLTALNEQQMLCNEWLPIWNLNLLSPITTHPPYSAFPLPTTQPTHQSRVALSHRKPASAMTSHDSCDAQVSDKRYTLWFSTEHMEPLSLGFRIEGWVIWDTASFYHQYFLIAHVLIYIVIFLCYTQESEHCMLSLKVWYPYMSNFVFQMLAFVRQGCKEEWTFC